MSGKYIFEKNENMQKSCEETRRISFLKMVFCKRRNNERDHLDGQYASFGKVTSGMDVVDAIATTKTGMQDRPVAEQKIASITVDVNGAQLAELKKLPDPYGRF